MPTDVFGNAINDRTNVLDVASHYPYNPERHRLFVDGSRVFPEYGSVAQYTHAVDRHELQPAAGETVTLESAERPRYVVAYELAATWAFAVNQSLQSGDSIRVGLYDGSDGWYMEHTGDQADTFADFVMERNGSEVYREQDVDIRVPVTQLARLRLETGWYNITRQRWERSYRNNGDQENVEIARVSAKDAGPEVGNLPVHFSVTASGSTSGLVLEAGSFAQVNLGRTVSLNRTKVFDASYTFSTTGTWVPFLALRVDPDRGIVNTQLSNIQVTEWGGSGDVNLIVQSHAANKVLDGSDTQLDDADFSTPAVFSKQNNVVETSSAVEKAPDSTGTPTTSADNPGGYQIGWGPQRQQGSGGNTKVTNRSLEVKRSLYPRDIAVVWGKADNTAEVDFEIRTEQDW